MRWTSAVSEASSLADAVNECAAKLSADLDGAPPDLVVAFVSAHHGASYDDLPALARAALPGGVLVGCSSGGVIGAGAEVEHRPGFAMAAAQLPGVSVTPFHVADSALPDGDAPPHQWESLFNTSGGNEPQFLLLADPFSVRGELLLMGLDYAFPSSVKIGGLASGGSQPGSNALFLGERRPPRGPGGAGVQRRHYDRHRGGAGLPSYRRAHADNALRAQHTGGGGRAHRRSRR